MTPLEIYARLKAHGVAFARTPEGLVDVLLLEGTVLPAALDQALLDNQGAIADIAIFVELVEPREWDAAAAIAETKMVFARVRRRVLARGHTPARRSHGTRGDG